jgi:hypothetical protein
MAMGFSTSYPSEITTMLEQSRLACSLSLREYLLDYTTCIEQDLPLSSSSSPLDITLRSLKKTNLAPSLLIYGL